MAAQPKLRRLLEMMEALRPPGITLKRFADNFDVSKRTAERYIKLFEEANLFCDKDAVGRYCSDLPVAIKVELLETFRDYFRNNKQQDIWYLFTMLHHLVLH